MFFMSANERLRCSHLLMEGTSSIGYRRNHHAPLSPSNWRLAITQRWMIHRKLPNTHLVMHGSFSVPEALQDIINKYGGQMKPTWGVPIEEIQRGIKNGVRKINIDGCMAMTGQIRRMLQEESKRVRSPQIYEAGHGCCDQALQGAVRAVRCGRTRFAHPASFRCRDSPALQIRFARPGFLLKPGDQRAAGLAVWRTLSSLSV